MELTDKILVKGTREAVFEALNDPEILRQAIPGCEELEAITPTSYRAVVTSKVGPMKIKFKGSAELSEIVPPSSYTITGEGKGGPSGHAKVAVKMNLEESGDDTLVEYLATANIGGKLAQLGGSLIDRTSKKLTAEFFTNLENLLAADVADSSPSESEVQEIPAASRQDQASGSGVLYLSVGAIVAIGALYFLFQ